MPALGMAQDTGRIVSWLKEPGDKVEDGEPLFEVETDKAVMEVPAPATGYLSAIAAAVDNETAVGAVIARIVDSEGEVEKSAPGPAAHAVPEKAAPREPEPAAAPAGPPAKTRARDFAPPTAAPRGRVLASPKARRMATERGIDLAALRARGVAEPIHADDLGRAALTGGLSVLTSRADATALDALLSKAAGMTDPSRLYAGFVAGAWQAVFESDRPAVLIQRRDGGAEATTVGDPVLRLVDLTGSRLTGFAPAGGAPTVTVARDGAAVVMMLAFSETALPFAAAAALLDELAARIEDPIRQLL